MVWKIGPKVRHHFNQICFFFLICLGMFFHTDEQLQNIHPSSSCPSNKLFPQITVRRKTKLSQITYRRVGLTFLIQLIQVAHFLESKLNLVFSLYLDTNIFVRALSTSIIQGSIFTKKNFLHLWIFASRSKSMKNPLICNTFVVIPCCHTFVLKISIIFWRPV